VLLQEDAGSMITPFNGSIDSFHDSVLLLEIRSLCQRDIKKAGTPELRSERLTIEMTPPLGGK
jgi:hypothetical protein